MSNRTLAVDLADIVLSMNQYRTAKLPMSVMKMLTLTTFSMPEPAAVRTALRLLIQAAVFCWMVPSTKLPSASQGIWPEQ